MFSCSPRTLIYTMKRKGSANSDTNKPGKDNKKCRNDSTQEAIYNMAELDGQFADADGLDTDTEADSVFQDDLIRLTTEEGEIIPTPPVAVQENQGADIREEGEIMSQSPVKASLPIFVPTDILNTILDTVLDMKTKLDQVSNSNTSLTIKIEKATEETKLARKLVKKQTKALGILTAELNKVKKKNSNLTKLLSRRPDLTVPPPTVESESPTDQTNMEVNAPTHTNTPRKESLADTKSRLVPNWRQKYFQRRDEYRREYRNLSKAESYDHYAAIKYLPRKLRPKFSRTKEEFAIKEEAAFKAMDAAKQVCILDAKQAQWNYSTCDGEVGSLIIDRADNPTEAEYMTKQWKKETLDAEPKARHLVQKESNFNWNLPQSDPYLGYEGLHNNTAEIPYHQNDSANGLYTRRQQNNDHQNDPANGLYSRRQQNNGRPGNKHGGNRQNNRAQPYGRNQYNNNQNRGHNSNFNGNPLNSGYDGPNNVNSGQHTNYYNNPNFRY